MENETDNNQDIVAVSSNALAYMQGHHIDPTPENYAVWFRYFTSEGSDFHAEIRRIEEQGVAVDNQLTEYLHTKYIEGELPDLDGHSESKEILSHVLTAINVFKGKTQSHNERLGRQTSKLSEHIEKAGIQDLMGEVVQQLRDIQSSGEDFHQRLDESHYEIKQLRERLQQAEAESKHDFLTGVYNRRALDEALLIETEQAERYIKDLSILMIDIDHFKPFNDKWGHQMGDEVLKAVSKAITKSIRGKDFVARFGGEEFTVLLPETPVSGARVVAENIRKTIANAKLQRKGSHEDIGRITVSIGAARYRIGENDTVPYLLKRADEALYAAKDAGRNRVVSEL